MKDYPCGIYGIHCLANDKWYVGQTFSTRGFKERWNTHRKELRTNRHCNPHFQSAWNKYGEDSFEFVILEELPKPTNMGRIEMREFGVPYEQKWIDHFDSYKNGFNRAPSAGTNLGVTYTDEQKRARSDAMKKRPRSRIKKQKKIKTPEEKRFNRAWATANARVKYCVIHGFKLYRRPIGPRPKRVRKPKTVYPYNPLKTKLMHEQKMMRREWSFIVLDESTEDGRFVTELCKPRNRKEAA